MGLVDYPSSDSEGESQPAAKKPRIEGSLLPPLPSNFRNLYSSTVRTSTQDDPELHGGRKRVTPHVAGNWPAHIYLECKLCMFLHISYAFIHCLQSGGALSCKLTCPPRGSPEKWQQALLSDVLDSIQCSQDKTETKVKDIHSLLENDLGVALPLHVSLSRPLSLRTAQKDTFLSTLTTSILSLDIQAFTVSPSTLTWHANEDRTRWFFVVSLQRPEHDELRGLLDVCNGVAVEFGQPLLYGESKDRGIEANHGKFHVSVAWSLVEQRGEVDFPKVLKQKLEGLGMEFDEVKIRIGQDVTSIPLRKRRKALFANEG